MRFYIALAIIIFFYVATEIFFDREKNRDYLAQQIEAVGKAYPFSDSLSLKYKAEAIKQLLDNDLKY